jgi:hypothetical protein
MIVPMIVVVYPDLTTTTPARLTHPPSDVGEAGL